MLARFSGFFACVAVMALVAATMPAHALEKGTGPDRRLKPRSETHTRIGNERRFLSSEVWTPLMQEENRVLYGDIRATVDNGDNREGNLGIGYRQMDFDHIWGGYAYFDRRQTVLGSSFHQVTLGAEYMRDDWEVHGNIYLPWGGARRYVGAVPSGPFLAGNGIFIAAPSEVVEEAQKGLDLEAGWRAPLSAEYLDSLRFYGGGYAFFGDETPDIIGLRTRIEADIDGRLQVGARAQHDGERGGQVFGEVTFRWPKKKEWRDHGLWSRMDDTPERDIDVVTGAAQRAGGAQPVVNAATGAEQKILYVNNAAAFGGDGTFESPFVSMTDALAAATGQDIIYVFAGDGTAARRNTGTTLAQPGLTIIGEGSPLVYDGGRYKSADGFDYTGLLLRPAGARPVFSNTSGDGVTIGADDVTVQGIHIDNATGYGLRVAGGVENLTLDNIYITGNDTGGMIVSNATAQATSAHVRHSVITGNGAFGVEIQNTGGGALSFDLGSAADAGDNAVFGNILQEVYANTGGQGVEAQGNYWGGGALSDTAGPNQGLLNSTIYATSLACDDCAIDAVTLADQTGAVENTRVTSAPVVLTGFIGHRYIETAGTGTPELVVNGTATGSATAKVQSGDTVSVALTSDITGLSTRTATLFTGNVSDAFSVQTRFLPNAIGGMIAWWDAGDIDGDFDLADNPANGTGISSWGDKSGNGHTAGQGVAGLQPLYQSNAQNGLGGVLADGIDDNLYVNTTGFFASLGTQETLFSVFRGNPSANNVALYEQGDCANFASSRCVMIRRDGNTNGGVLRIDTSGGNDQNTAATPVTLFDNAPHILTTQINGSNFSLFDKGVSILNGSYTPGTGIGTAAGLYPVSAINGAYYETIVFASALSSTDRALVENYLATKWSIP